MPEKVYSIKKEVERPSNMKHTKVGFGSIVFTRAQIKILERMGEGYSNKQIAETMCISVRTVESHLVRIKKTLADFFGYKFCDRELVIFARTMIDEYRDFIQGNLEGFSRTYVADNFDIKDFELLLELEEARKKYKLLYNRGIDLDCVDPCLETWYKKRNGY